MLNAAVCQIDYLKPAFYTMKNATKAAGKHGPPTIEEYVAYLDDLCATNDGGNILKGNLRMRRSTNAHDLEMFDDTTDESGFEANVMTLIHQLAHSWKYSTPKSIRLPQSLTLMEVDPLTDVVSFVLTARPGHYSLPKTKSAGTTSRNKKTSIILMSMVWPIRISRGGRQLTERSAVMFMTSANYWRHKK
jgi:hypothetical protein